MSESEMVKIGEHSVRRDILDLVERCIQCMNIKAPDALKRIWSRRRPAGWHACHFTSGDFKFTYDTHHSILIEDISGERAFSVCYIDLDKWDFSWDEHVVLNFVIPETQRILVLDDLSKVTECEWSGCVLAIDHNGAHKGHDGKYWWHDPKINAESIKRSPDIYGPIPTAARPRARDLDVECADEG
jgi:hypothetical protein